MTLSESVRLDGKGVEISTAALFSHAAEVIVKVAKIRQCDFIMGSRGSGSINAFILGSQTQKVISLANCPVLEVR
jgi:nucleotide-binding universal stress UspA family protein